MEGADVLCSAPPLSPLGKKGWFCFAPLPSSIVIPVLEKGKKWDSKLFSPLGKKEAGRLECCCGCVVLPHPIPPDFTTARAVGCGRSRRAKKNHSRSVPRSKGQKWEVTSMSWDSSGRGGAEKWIVHYWSHRWGGVWEITDTCGGELDFLHCWVAKVTAEMIQLLLGVLVTLWMLHAGELRIGCSKGSSNTAAFPEGKNAKTL